MGESATGVSDAPDGQAPDGFVHCPRCRAPELAFEAGKRHACHACGWTFYRNAAAAVFGIVEHEGRVLLVRRARDPTVGTLDLPGGFVDLGETAEAALVRELHEELSVQVTGLAYLGTYPNVYPYRGVTYHTLDLCFHGQLLAPPDTSRVDTREIAGFELVPRAAVELESVGMDSPRRALADFLAREPRR